MIRFFPLFLPGAIFGKLMDVLGCAKVIAAAIVKQVGPGQVLLAEVVACEVLSYGGVCLFAITSRTHKKRQADIFVVVVAIPPVALVAILILGSIFGSF